MLTEADPPREPDPAHVVVVGGGISGLAAAWWLDRLLGRAVRVTVLEARQQVGGHLEVGELAGVPVDLGAEAMLARRTEGVDLATAVGLGPRLVTPRPATARLLHNHALYPLPGRTFMGVPGDLTALGEAGLFSESEIAVVRDRISTLGPALAGDATVGAALRARAGDTVVDRLVEPLLSGVYAGHVDQLSLQATMPGLHTALQEPTTMLDAVRGLLPDPGQTSSQPVFAGISGGLGLLPGAVAKASGATIRTGVTVREIGHDASGARGWVIESGPRPAPAYTRADAVILAVPGAPTARLLRPHLPAAAARLQAVPWASVGVITFAVPLEAVARVPDVSGYLVPPAEQSALKASTFSWQKWDWTRQTAAEQGVAVLRGSVGRSGEVACLQRDDASLIEAAWADVRAAVPITGAPVAARVDRWGGALPQYGVGHVESMAQVRADVATEPRLAVCGATYDGVGVPACIASARAAAEEVVAGLGHGHVRIGS